jgi:CheY-like chemotaxis protein
MTVGGDKGIPLLDPLSSNDLVVFCLKKAKIYFVVDDDIEDQQFLIEALMGNDPSCQCFTALNGQEAISNLLDEITPIPDVIFLDLNMPVLNGKKCLAIVKQTPAYQHIPVIIYSTTSSKQEIQEIVKQGAAHFLMKTHNFNELREELTSIDLMANNDPDIG